MNRKLFTLTAVAVAVVLGLSLVRTNAQEDPEGLVGKEAPDFTLKTLDGKEAKLSGEKGNVVLIDFWATWCPPCRKSLPNVQAISADEDKAKKGLKVWAVNAREAEDKVKAYLEENKFTFAVPMDADGAVMKQYGVRGIPTTVIVGRDGTVKNVFVGFGNGSEEKINTAVDEALKEEKVAKAE